MRPRREYGGSEDRIDARACGGDQIAAVVYGTSREPETTAARVRPVPSVGTSQRRARDQQHQPPPPRDPPHPPEQRGAGLRVQLVMPEHHAAAAGKPLQRSP